MLRSLHLEGDLLSALEQQLNNELSSGEKIFAVRILSDGKQENRTITASSVPDAKVLARKELPSDATEIEIKTVSTPSQRRIILKATDEHSARAAALIEASVSMKSPSISSIQELKTNRGFVDFLRGQHHYEVEIFSRAIVDIYYKRVAKLDAWLTAGQLNRSIPYKSQLYIDLGINCTFEIPSQWKPLGATVDAQHPAARFFVLAFVAQQEGLEGEMSFVPGKILDDLSDCKSRRIYLENRIQTEVWRGFTFKNIRYRNEMESVAGEDNTVVASAEIVGHEGYGQVVLSTVHDKLHYMFEYYGQLNDFIFDSMELIRSSFVFPPAEIVEKLLTGKRTFSSPAHAGWQP